MSVQRKSFSPQWQDYELIAEHLLLERHIAKNLIELFENGNQIPFIARYRKNKTNDMSPQDLRDAKSCYRNIKAVKQRMHNVLNALSEMQVLDEYLIQKITNCRNVDEIEHIYAPYKSGAKKSLAEQAKELGLEKPAVDLLQNNVPVVTTQYVNASRKGLQNEEDVEKGIKHIMASVIVANADVLTHLRMTKSNINFIIETKKSSKIIKENVDESKYANYFNFKCYVKFIKPHQVLAINRGESQNILTVKIEVPYVLKNEFTRFCQKKFAIIKKSNVHRNRLINEAIEDAYTQSILPLIRRQIRAELKLIAEQASFKVFATNLKQLLLIPPVKGKKILAIDPGFAHGCKIALISETGRVLNHTVIYPHKDKHRASHILKNLLNKYKCTLIALGNGKGCRFAEQCLIELIKSDVSYTIIAEDGVSIYSCSDEASKEFGSLDPNVIGAISLARRLQDPLAELVKVEPRHLGIGMYQHDVDREKLEAVLDEVVSECVSFVGIDLNTASQCLLRKVAGLTDESATHIVRYRKKYGPFITRKQLLEVKCIDERVFEQCAGFLRVGPVNETEITYFYKESETTKLDLTDIHPESYKIAERLLEMLRLNVNHVGSQFFVESINSATMRMNKEDIARKLNAPITTVDLILEAFAKPLSHDLRTTHTHAPLFKKGLVDIHELSGGVVLNGRINNVTPFGCFVDIGVGCNGLIHCSKMNRLSLQLGDRVEVKVVSIDIERKRISLEAMTKL